MRSQPWTTSCARLRDPQGISNSRVSTSNPMTIMFVYGFPIRLTSKHLRRPDRKVGGIYTRARCGFRFPSLFRFPHTKQNDSPSFLLTLSSNNGGMNMEQRCFVMPPRCFAAAFLTDAGGGETTRVDAEGLSDGGAVGQRRVYGGGWHGGERRERDRERE